ncbi:MAG: hypothetical protein R2911_28700 [Caldilineaceae bacterium]
MKEMIICLSMGFVGHLLIFRGIDPPALVHNLALWSVVGISLSVFSFINNLLQPLKRRSQSISHRDAISHWDK